MLRSVGATNRQCATAAWNQLCAVHGTKKHALDIGYRWPPKVSSIGICDLHCCSDLFDGKTMIIPPKFALWFMIKLSLQSSYLQLFKAVDSRRLCTLPLGQSGGVSLLSHCNQHHHQRGEALFEMPTGSGANAQMLRCGTMVYTDLLCNYTLILF